nr:4-(cytidine 5'-diphospho)-2-C-methyl-D-erythritol kinase [uncultured Actinomyces sp.]
MREVRASAPGKVNLTLRVGAPTPDGYHPLVTVFEALNLRETVTVRTSKTPGVRVETIAYLPDGSVDEATTRAMADVDPATHLAVRAARVLQRLAAAGPWASTAAGLSIRVDKRVPVAGGMAGGSADAAAALVACNELWELGLGDEQLHAIGRSLGADVPACLAGGIALGTGRGDHMSVLREGDEAGAEYQHHWVMLLAHEGLSTPSVFREFDRVDAAGAPALAEPTPEEVAALCGEPEELSHCLVNDLQAPALRLRPELADTIASAKEAGALAVTLSGSGPTVAALARDAEHARTLAATLSDAPTVARAIPTHGPACGARIESTEAI